MTYNKWIGETGGGGGFIELVILTITMPTVLHSQSKSRMSLYLSVNDKFVSLVINDNLSFTDYSVADLRGGGGLGGFNPPPPWAAKKKKKKINVHRKTPS